MDGLQRAGPNPGLRLQESDAAPDIEKGRVLVLNRTMLACLLFGGSCFFLLRFSTVPVSTRGVTWQVRTIIKGSNTVHSSGTHHVLPNPFMELRKRKKCNAAGGETIYSTSYYTCASLYLYSIRVSNFASGAFISKLKNAWYTMRAYPSLQLWRNFKQRSLVEVYIARSVRWAPNSMF